MRGSDREGRKKGGGLRGGILRRGCWLSEGRDAETMVWGTNMPIR